MKKLYEKPMVNEYTPAENIADLNDWMSDTAGGVAGGVSDLTEGDGITSYYLAS